MHSMNPWLMRRLVGVHGEELKRALVAWPDA